MFAFSSPSSARAARRGASPRCDARRPTEPQNEPRPPWRARCPLTALGATPVVVVTASLTLTAALTAALAAGPARAEATAPPVPSAAEQLLARLADPELRQVALEVLERHPELEALERRARARGYRAVQAGGLPDPTVAVRFFALPPETRVGPQRFSLDARQRLPWPAERRLGAQAAQLDAERLRFQREALELRLLTRVRELWIELAFAHEQDGILADQRHHLVAHEESARAKYASGRGSATGPIGLHAEISRLDHQRLAVAEQIAVLEAELASLRDHWGDAVPFQPELASLARPAGALETRLDALVERALRQRPEMAMHAVDRRQAELATERARLDRRPDLALGVAFTAVERRDDEAGRSLPPEGNGDDILALTATLDVPLWGRPYDAALAEATEDEARVGAETRTTALGIRRRVAELLSRLPLEDRQLGLLEGTLAVQATEAVRQATAGYAAGSLGALHLLDAEHRLFEVRLAVARSRADLALVAARLEGELAGPLDDVRAGSPIDPATDFPADPVIDPSADTAADPSADTAADPEPNS